jgi:tensin
MLAVSEVGSFVVRDSTTHPRCYALSVKVPRTDKPAGVCHYLIQPATDGKGYKMKVRFSGTFAWISPDS